MSSSLLTLGGDVVIGSVVSLESREEEQHVSYMSQSEVRGQTDETTSVCHRI